MTPESEKNENPLLESLTKIASVYMDRNTLQPEQVPPLLEGILRVLVKVPDAGRDRTAVPVVTAPNEVAPQEPATPAPAPSGPLQPAVPIEQSITPDHLVCLEDGAKVILLKRHLSARYNMTPRDYRDRWGLPNDYPMVAPTYSKRRSAAAKAIGLGQRRPVEPPVDAAPPVAEPVAAPAEIAPPAPTARRPRARKAAVAAPIAPAAVTEGGRRPRATRGKSAAAATEAQAAIAVEAPSDAPSPAKKVRGRAKLEAAPPSKPRARKAKSTA